jgi:hypothetical protein
MKLNGDSLMEFKNPGDGTVDDMPQSFNVDICANCKFLYAYDPNDG